MCLCGTFFHRKTQVARFLREELFEILENFSKIDRRFGKLKNEDLSTSSTTSEKYFKLKDLSRIISGIVLSC